MIDKPFNYVAPLSLVQRTCTDGLQSRRASGQKINIGATG